MAFLDGNLLQSFRAGDKPRAMRPFGRCHHHGTGILVRNEDIVRASATSTLATSVVRLTPSVEAVRITICQGNIHDVVLPLGINRFKLGYDFVSFQVNSRELILCPVKKSIPIPSVQIFHVLMSRAAMPHHAGTGRSARVPRGQLAPNPSCRCTHWKPSCLVMAATAIEPPTVLGRATENFTKPIVVSTR